MNKCQFSEKCKNDCLGKLNFCYLKNHNIDKDLYNQEIVNIKNEFNQRTLQKTQFKIQKIERDGACMFKCMAKFIIKNLEQYSEKLPDLYGLIKSIMESSEHISDKEEDISELIQLSIKDWVISNPDYFFTKFNMSIRQLIPIVHGEEGIITIDDYGKYFSIYAGDSDHINIEKNVDEVIVLERQEIPERWGTMLELFSFMKVFSTNINIYILKKIDTKNFKSVVCSNRSKNYRYFLSQELFDKSSELSTLNLYFNTIYSNPHYELLL
jgi:hypothetical protein